jgi:hypothetical protein
MTSISSVAIHPVSSPAQPRQASQVLQGPPAAESAAQEAEETPAVTRQEAAKGDRAAQRKLAREQARATSAETAKDPTATSQGTKGKTGRSVSVVA